MHACKCQSNRHCCSRNMWKLLFKFILMAFDEPLISLCAFTNQTLFFFFHHIFVSILLSFLSLFVCLFFIINFRCTFFPSPVKKNVYMYVCVCNKVCLCSFVCHRRGKKRSRNGNLSANDVIWTGENKRRVHTLMWMIQRSKSLKRWMISIFEQRKKEKTQSMYFFTSTFITHRIFRFGVSNKNVRKREWEKMKYKWNKIPSVCHCFACRTVTESVTEMQYYVIALCSTWHTHIYTYISTQVSIKMLCSVFVKPLHWHYVTFRIINDSLSVVDSLISTSFFFLWTIPIFSISFSFSFYMSMSVSKNAK